MEWNQSSLNGAIAPPQNQQYLLPSTSSMVANGQSQSGVQQSTLAPNRYLNTTRDHILQHLLKAQTNEDYLKVQQAALGNFKIQKSSRMSSRMKPSLNMSSYKPAHETVLMPDNRGSVAGQNTVGSNYRMSTHVNTVHQTPQQLSSVAVGQQFGEGYNCTAVQQPLQNSQALQNYQPTVTGYNGTAVQQPLQNSQALQNYQPAVTGYNGTAVQQPPKNSQALQNYQSNVTYTFPQQNSPYTSVRSSSNAVQMPCQQMASNGMPFTMYNLQNGVSGQYSSSQNLPAETNVSPPVKDCRNNQNIRSPSLTNYKSLAPNMLPHVPQQQMSVPQTLPQLDGNANCYSQSQQRPNLQTVLVNNSPQGLSAAAGTMPPAYTQATTSPPNVFSASVNQNFSKQRQNYVAPNVQQPAQTGNPPPVESSEGGEQARVREQIASTQRKREMFKLLQIYRNVRVKYELLNRENNLLRQRLHASTSQENAGAPPLLSSLPTAQPQAAQQNVTQAMPVQNSAQKDSAMGFQGQNAVNASNQAGIHCNRSLQENAFILNQMFKSDNGNLGQNNYSVFDGGQTNVANGSTSASQSLSSETLTPNVCQEVTSRKFQGQTNSNNQYTSSPNSSDVNVMQNGLDKQLSVTQTLNPACHEKNSYEHLPSYTTALNGQLMPVSREAIEASLPLWKNAAQSSSQSTNRSSQAQQNQSPVDSSLVSFMLLDEITLGPTNEVSSTITVQKPDSALQNQANPQIAIVPPLVQSKEALHEDYQLSKVCIQGPDVDNTTINGLMNPRENECFNKILQALESLGDNTMNSMEILRSKGLSFANQDNVDSSLTSSAEIPSENELKVSSKDVEIVDDNLQISGICTLVEGNSFYDSSIAMMFDTLDTKTFPYSNTRDDHSKIVDAPCSTSPEAVTVAIKSAPDDDDDDVAVGQRMKSEISCTDMKVDHHMVSAQQESCGDLESSAISDQLSELLMEFPYGIKNYMSENIHKSSNVPLGKTTDNAVLKVSTALEDSDPVSEGKAFGVTQTEMSSSRSVNLQHVAKIKSEPSMDLEPKAEKLSPELQQTTERVPVPTKDDRGSVSAMDTCSDDFEIISNSPVSDIQIMLLDQDEIPKIFSDESENVVSEKCNEIKLEGLLKNGNAEEPATESPLLNKESADVTEAGTDQNLFCCLFSWLTHTNGNAPKCNCKQLELSKEVVSAQLLNNSSVSILKADPSPHSPEPALRGLPKQNDGSVIGFEILQPTDRPPKLDLVDSDDEEILQPMDKPPTLVRVVSEEGHVQKPGQDFTPQAENLKPSTSVENVQVVKDSLMKNNAVSPPHSTPSPGNGKPNCSESKDQFSKKFKFHGSRRSEKLIVKTDFLKNKHPYKDKRKSERKDGANVAQSTSNESGSLNGVSKNSTGEHGKRPQGERVEQNTSARAVEQSPDQQADRNRQKSSPPVDRSSPPQTVKKRKKKESHFEKTKRVPTVQQYLERKRELCNQRSDARTEPKEGLEDLKHTVEKPLEMSGNPNLNLKRPLSPAKTNVTSKENSRQPETLKGSYRKDRPQRGRPREAGHRKRKDPHNGQRTVPENKTQKLSRTSSKDKIYLSPCVGSRRASYEGINLAKLQIRHSPEKPKHTTRRRSLESSSRAKPPNPAMRSKESPKMLEFKLYPEFAPGSPTVQDKTGEAVDSKAKVVEGIKVSKEAWCNSIPLKKRRVHSVESQDVQPTSAASTPNYKPLEKTTTRTPQDTRTTFNVFKQLYQKQRSRSLDCSQGNS